MRFVFVLLLACILVHAKLESINIAPINYHSSAITVLDQKEMVFDAIDGVKFTELSDLAYDKQSSILYAVGDRGSLFTFDIKLSNHIEKLSPLYATKLKTKKGKKLRKWKRDSEGLTLDGKGRLIISFEGKPKIGWFHKNSKKRGSLIRKYSLPRVLRKKASYRSKNKSLESLAWHHRYGMITAAEWPLKKDDKKLQTIYALNGKQWHFKAEPEPRSAVTAIEVMDDGNILVLERSYTNLLSPFVVTLKKIEIDKCQSGLCPSKVLLKMNNHKGWNVDNFEGLTRVEKNRYLMVSDDNDNFFQKTILVYFEVK